PEEGNPGAPTVVVLSHGLWQRRFGGDRSVIGKSVTLNGVSRTVVGIMPVDFELQFPTNKQIDLWVPRIFSPQLTTIRQSHFLYVFGRLKSGVTFNQAEQRMATIAQSLAKEHPDTNKDVSIRLVPLHQQIVGKVRTPLLILLGVVGLVLLIACANVANLLLGR